MTQTTDFAIVGAGIVGLTIARALRQRHPDTSIAVFEKEPALGLHGSGRNSGVIHSGIYYPAGSLKAKICADGARRLAEYYDEHELPIRRVGKLIVPLRAEDGGQLEVLQERGVANGAPFQLVGESEIGEIEPEARSATGQALYNPNVAVIEPKAVLEHLAERLLGPGVEIRKGAQCRLRRSSDRLIEANGETYSYGHLFNAAGLQADLVAHQFGAGDRYRILPFKGSYYRLSEQSGLQVNGLIYPVPDLRFPWLGLHTTKTVSGSVYLGPTATVALGRENYRWSQGISFRDISSISFSVARQYLRDTQGFRRYMHQEAPRFLKSVFVRAMRQILPRVRPRHLQRSDKLGIRAQLFDLERGELQMDFVVEQADHSTHVLNAVSPALTCSFSFADFVLEQAGF